MMSQSLKIAQILFNRLGFSLSFKELPKLSSIFSPLLVCLIHFRVSKIDTFFFTIKNIRIFVSAVTLIMGHLIDFDCLRGIYIFFWYVSKELHSVLTSKWAFVNWPCPSKDKLVLSTAYKEALIWTGSCNKNTT